MEQEKIKPDEVLFNSLLDGCCKSNEIDLALTVYDSMKTQNIRPSNVTFSILVKIYGKSKQLSKALGVLEEMHKLHIKPGIVVYTCIFSTCIKAKQISIAFEKFEEMKTQGIQGDGVTYQTLLKGCVQFRKFVEGGQILHHAAQNKVFIQKDISESILSGMGQCKDKTVQTKISEIRELMQSCRGQKGGYTKSYSMSSGG